ncbi:hypothetical protein [Tumebacillus flagellatus]|uniref:Uncharacterized protein n=1 Tax=Tumebacillus flagellatus TaxID=1157490 RepID=A0A074M5A1_9BACL|nr:hypothetical protein [Tumebacillus flagellatus]KEO81147.1 hypothetical protein EL26_22445 [Tumebacillus flagellatus]
MTTRENRLWREMQTALCEAPGVTLQLVENWRDHEGLCWGLLAWLSGEAASAHRMRKEALCRASVSLELLWLSQRLQEESPVSGVAGTAGGIRPLEQYRIADYLYAKGLSLTAGLPSEVAREIAEEACRFKADRLLWNPAEWGEHAALELAYRKLGRWTAVCCKVGALLGACEERVREALIQYGFSLGMAVASDGGSAVLYRQKALSCLSALPDGETKSLLRAVPDAFMLGKGRAFLDV